MKKAVVSIVVAVFMATGLPVGVSAQGQFEEEERRGAYVVLDVGSRSFLSQAEVVVSATSASSALALDYDVGYVFGGRFGYDMGNGFRSELVVSYSDNQVEFGGFREMLNPDGSLDSTVAILGNTDVSTLNVLAKGFFDLRLNQFNNFVPYAGISLGYGRSKIESVTGTSGTIPGDTESLFAYGGTLGFRYFVSDKFAVGLESSSLIYYDSEDPESSYNLKARVYYSF